MFIYKYKKIAKLNEITNLCNKLHVKYRASEAGISILNDKIKFFSIDEIYLDNTECINYIKSVADPSLQTYFL